MSSLFSMFFGRSIFSKHLMIGTALIRLTLELWAPYKRAMEDAELVVEPGGWIMAKPPQNCKANYGNPNWHKISYNIYMVLHQPASMRAENEEIYMNRDNISKWNPDNIMPEMSGIVTHVEPCHNMTKLRRVQAE